MGVDGSGWGSMFDALSGASRNERGEGEVKETGWIRLCCFAVVMAALLLAAWGAPAWCLVGSMRSSLHVPALASAWVLSWSSGSPPQSPQWGCV